MSDKIKYWENRKAGKRGQDTPESAAPEGPRKNTRAFKRAELRSAGKLKGNKRNRINTITREQAND